MTHPTATPECTRCTRMAWSPAEQAALSEIMHDRTRWPLLECKGEGADAVFDEAKVAARRAAVRAQLPRRSWAGIISRMYRSGADTANPLLVFGPRLNCKNIDRQGRGERVHVQKTWKKWTSAQDAALTRELLALPDVREPLSRAEVLRRQELLRLAVSPLRSWMSLYLKICREHPYGLDLGHMLKTKLGKSCRQHMTPLRKFAVGKRGTRGCRSGVRCRAGAGAGAAELWVQAAQDCASPLVLQPSEDGALQSPSVLRVADSPDLCFSDGECALHTTEMFLWH